MSLPTLDDFKQHLGVTSNKDDGELLNHLYSAIDVVEGIVGPLRDGEVTETHRGMRSDVLILRSRPALEVVSVSARYYLGGALTVQPLADYELDTDAGLLRLASGGHFVGDVRVTYRAGREHLPESIRLAALIIGKSLWETQRGSQPLPLQGAADTAPADVGYAPGIPERARVLLEPYASTQQIA